MKEIIPNIQTVLEKITEIKHIDEDWGQLSYFGANIPVKWPCVLVSISSTTFSNTFQDKKLKPMERQQGDVNLEITIANLKLTNTSAKSTEFQKEFGFNIWNLISKVHTELQGFKPDVNASKLIRIKLEKIKREDSVQEYIVSYSCSLSDV